MVERHRQRDGCRQLARHVSRGVAFTYMGVFLPGVLHTLMGGAFPHRPWAFTAAT